MLRAQKNPKIEALELKMAKTSPNLSELNLSYLLIVIKIHQIASPTQKSQKSSKIVKIGILQVIACEYWILSGHGLILEF